jgi:poly-gamma-glutamate synthesis protein (capsule biosynthesis protein)
MQTKRDTIVQRKSLPHTPADVLQVSSAPLRLLIKLVVKAAEVFGFWRRPLKGAATASEEMNAIDNLYWIYKTRNPIAQPGYFVRKQQAAQNLNLIVLPENFEPVRSLTVSASGDILRSKGIDGSKDIVFENVSELLFDQDIAFANFESPITSQTLVEEIIGDKGPPLECCSRSQFEILSGHKGRIFNVLNLANNHMLDMGLEGIETTLEVLAEKSILNVGLNNTPEEYGQAKIFEAHGLKVGFVTDCFGLNGHRLPKGEEYRIHVSNLLSKHVPPDTRLLKMQIDDCKKKQCDFVIASIHWGYEFEFFPRERQITIARMLIEYGADSILSHHPHVIQPVEIYQTERDRNRFAVIAYSLGSLTWGFMAPHITLSLILNLKLTNGFLDGKKLTYIDDLKVTPVFRAFLNEADGDVTRIEKLVDHIQDDTPLATASQVAKMEEIVALVLGEDWRGHSN